jgi:hypothetical protein
MNGPKWRLLTVCDGWNYWSDRPFRLRMGDTLRLLFSLLKRGRRRVPKGCVTGSSA